MACVQKPLLSLRRDAGGRGERPDSENLYSENPTESRPVLLRRALMP